MHVDWWTLALQTVNVLVLIWILARFFFRPVVAIIARRQEEAGKLLADAAAVREQARHVREEADKAHGQIDAERDRLVAEARKAAQLEKAGLLTQAAEEIAKLRNEAKAAIDRDRIAADDALVARAGELSVEIAQRLLARLPPGAGLSVFLDGLTKEVEALPPEIRQTLASPKAGSPVEIVTAAPLSEDDKKHVGSALKGALEQAAIVFRSDPTVIAGIELHSRNTIVRNSWRADLDRIRQELSHAEQPSKA
jgi:F-type H+-transporting ATPase subunit b